ncbi:MAG: PKD domain-containing protein [Chitinophagales bacterium]
MKTLIQIFTAILLLSLFFLSSCQDDDIYIGEIETEIPNVSFTATPWSENPNYIILNNTSTGDGMFAAWRFNAGGSFQRDASMEQDTAYYPEMGDYEITLLVGNDAGYDSLKTTVMVNQRDIDLPDPNADNCLLLGDFEDGEVGGWNSWGQAVSVEDNPKPSPVNPSSKVLKMTQTDPFSQNANLTADFYSPNAIKITVDVYFEVAGSLKLQIEPDFGTGYFQDVAAGEWVTLEYDLQGQIASGGEYPWVLIQGNTAGNYYIDNIKYCALDIAADNCSLLGDFEDGEVGDWNAWGQNVTVVENPSVSPENLSSKVLKMTQTDAFGENANRSIPVVTENATKVTVDVYFEAGGSLKLQIEEDFNTGYFQDVAAGTWVTLEYNLVGEVSADINYPWILIQGNTPGSYYIDNIRYCE